MHPISGILKRTYWPICRLYAKHFVGDNQADAFLRLLCSIEFWRVNRFWPNFLKPQRFSEKLWSRMLHERDPLFTLISDKLRVRDYVSNKVGSDCLIPLLWQGDKPEDIPYDELPMKFVIHTNHGCGYVIIVNDKANINKKKITRQLNKWLGTNFGLDTFLGIAWGYKNVKPTIIIESFIEENGRAPVDYKVSCFSGHAEYITLHFDRFENHSIEILDRNFESPSFAMSTAKWRNGTRRPKPPNFEKLVQLAEDLARGFDFMRVDLYSVQNKLYFGEFTPYPNGVSKRYFEGEQDYIFGEKWIYKGPKTTSEIALVNARQQK